jgi:alanine dehydrogenase
MTLFLDNPAVEQVLTMAECMDALEEAHAEMGRGRVANGPTFRILTPQSAADIAGASDPVHHVYTSLSASIKKWNVVGQRVDSAFIHYPIVNGVQRQVQLASPANGKFCGFVKLYDSITCEPLAIIHDGFLQKYRVAGTEGLGTKWLAKKNAKTLGLIGSGWQASAAIEAHCLARTFELVKVYSPTKSKREAFAKEWSAKLGVTVRAVDTAEEATRGSDVVNTVTNALTPVIDTAWIEPGMFITTVKDSNELDLAAFERADLLVFNRPGPMWERYAIGGLDGFPEQGHELWGQGNKIDWVNITIFGEVVAGIKPGRTNDDQVIILPLKGDGMQFTAVAYRIYELAKKRGLGTKVDTDLWLQDAKYIP